MQTCTFFASYTAWFTRELEKADPDLSGPDRPSSMNKQQWERFLDEKKQRYKGEKADASSIEEKLKRMGDAAVKFEDNFSRHLQILLDALNHYAATETVVLLGLCARLSTCNQGTQYSGLRTDGEGGPRS